MLREEGSITEVVEREHKYDLEPSQQLPAFESALGHGERLERVVPVELDATYFDTERGRLLGAGITLRQRHGGADAGWHLKIPGDDRWTRTEIRRALGDPDVAEVPSELADLVFAVSRGQPLVPVAYLHTDRSICRVLDGRGDWAVEIADDHVRAERFSDHTPKVWREVEVEERAGGSATATRIRSLLHERGIEESAERSKVARVLEGSPSIGHEAPPQSPSRHDVLRRRLTEQTAELVARDLDVRRGDEEAVHAMRVASRRLRSCLRTFTPELPPGCSELSDELQWLASALGRARDAQVMRARLQRDATELLSPSAIASVRAVLDARLDIELREATTALDEVLRSDRYRSLLQTLDEYIECLGVCNPTSRRRAGLLKYVKREARHARRAIVASQRATGPRRDLKIHGARKAAKRARYAAETVVPVAGKSAERVARRFEEIQELLGNRQDAVVVRAFLGSLASSTHERSGLSTTEVQESLELLADAALTEIRAIDATLEHLRRRAKAAGLVAC